MKKVLILTFLTILYSANLFAQKEKYPSKEEDEYYKNLDRNYVPFKPLDKEFILDFKPEHYEMHESGLNYEPYSPDKYLTPYADSVYSKMFSRDFDIQKIVIETIGKYLQDDL